jgi:ribonuclease BN (tRNA processing enzyme)
MIEVTFLGVGAALTAAGQTNCAYLIRVGGACILFDCGPAVLQQLAAVGRGPGEVTHLFVSHRHGDHALGYPMFLLWWSLEGRRLGLVPPAVIAGGTTWVSLRALWEHAYADAPLLEVRAVELPEGPGSYAVAPGITLRTWPMVHSAFAPVLGARLEAEGKVVAFTADAARSDTIRELARDAHLLIHDARYAATVGPEESIQGRFHCSARDAGEYAAEGGVRNLALVHLGAEYAGREADVVEEARRVYTGHVFAPVGGEVFIL